MQWTVLERFSVARSGDQASNEDGIFVSDDFAVVLDGVTAKSPQSWSGLTGGAMAVKIITAACKGLPRDASAQQAITIITSAIADVYAHAGMTEEMALSPEKRIAASMIMISAAREEIWSVGDSQALFCADNGAVIGHLWNAKPLDEAVARVRAAYLEAELAAGTSQEELLAYDSGREMILPLLRRYTVFQNSTREGFGYGVVNGFPIPNEEIIISSLADSDRRVASIVLASDGYPQLHASLAASERALQVLLAKDPLCIHENRQTKGMRQGDQSYDDRTFLSLRLDEPTPI